MDINELAILTDSYTGADLAGLVRQASLYALKESITSTVATSQINVSKSNFTDALSNTKSSISEQVKRKNSERKWEQSNDPLYLSLSCFLNHLGQTSLRETAEDLHCDARLVWPCP